jgi:hypothetical protein
VFWNLYDREKSVQLKNFFLFQVFDLRFFTNFFILQQCSDPNPNPNLFVGFGSSQNIRIHSDSDPQHFLQVLALISRAGHVERYQLQRYRFKPFFVTLYSYRF